MKLTTTWTLNSPPTPVLMGNPNKNLHLTSLVAGRDVKEWDAETLKSRCGAIFQDFVKYELTVGENVGVARCGKGEGGRGIRLVSERLEQPVKRLSRAMAMYTHI